MNGTINQTSISGVLSNNVNLNGTLNSPKLIGKIENAGGIKGMINAGLNMVGVIKSDLLSGTLDIGGTYQDYSGSYNVTPKTEGQILETENKILRQDVLIKRIPYFETSNDYGETIYIGSEVI